MQQSTPPGAPPPRVLVVMPEQWRRALLRAALREAGYDAVGTRDLDNALRIPPAERDRGPVRLVVIDQQALGRGSDAKLEQLLAREGRPKTILISSATTARPTGPWDRVLSRPLSIADVVASTQELVPLPPEARHALD
jgi:DNA-binding response OmpR family regulator